MFVLIMHAAVTYSGDGSWYYKESSVFGNFSFYFFSFYQTFTQAYFMSLLFMVAGYFTVPSLERKSTKTFILDRLFRLGIPTLLYTFFLHPLCAVLVSADVRANFFSKYWYGIKTLQFFSWTGPLWFAETLLVFSLVYVLVQKGFDRLLSKFSLSVSSKHISLLILFIALFAFLLRHFFPLGTAIMNLSLCYFSAYIFMFLAGIASYKKNLLEQIDKQVTKVCLLISLGVGVLPWVPMIYGDVREISIWRHEAGSFIFALWESVVCVTTVIALIGIFKKKFNTQSRWQKFLSANAFAVYFYHPPILIAVTLLLKGLELATLLKFFIASILTIIASVLVSSFLRRFSLLRKVFS